MAFTNLYDGGMGVAPTRQVCAIGQNTEVSVTIVTGVPYYLPQNVHGSAPAGNQWLGFTRPVFGYSLWVTRNASLQVILYMVDTTERTFKGWRLYKGVANVISGIELPAHQFKVKLYNDETLDTLVKGYVSVRSQ